MLFKSKTHDRKIFKITYFEIKQSIGYIRLTIPKIKMLITFVSLKKLYCWQI